jgi:3-hydroxyisobutyrate dehydrogenase-like beta-hydroxyacid dehydrogenase
MPRKSRKNVGLIGLGIIGTRVAQGLRAAGFHVFVWNRTAKPAPNFLGSPAEIAEVCDVIQLFVADGAALKSVIEAFSGALTSNHVIVCSGTVGPEATLEAAAKVKEKGARFLDAPFTGSKVAAEKRQLVYYIGGEDAAYKKAEPVLKAVSKSLVHCGAIGHAAVLKVATNMITAVSVQTLAEALALITKAGLSPETFAAALEQNACRSGVVDLKLPKMVAGDYEPHFSLKHMFKDVQLAIHMANEFKIEAPATTVTAGVMFGALNHGWADLDYASLFKLYDDSFATSPAELSDRGAAASAAEILLEAEYETDEKVSAVANETAQDTDSPGVEEPIKVAAVERTAPEEQRDGESKAMEVVADVPRDAKLAAEPGAESVSAKDETDDASEKVAESATPSSRPFNRIRRFFSTAGK